jgi:anti-sigma B factor antagonist
MSDRDDGAARDGHRRCHRRGDRVNDEVGRLIMTTTMTGPSAMTLAVCGELDVATVDRFGVALDLSLARPGIRWVTLDLRELSFLDSTGIARLVAARATASAVGARLTVVNATGMVRRVLEVTGVDRELIDEMD